MLGAMTLRDMQRWRMFYATEPWGPERDDMRAEVQRLRMLGGSVGQHHGQMIPWHYPYSLEAELDKAAKKLEQEAEAARQRHGVTQDGNGDSRQAKPDHLGQR